ncbi:MAG: type II toxin-antitoxin system Phd/YefM family antitoxin [Pseudomonadota bacterium]
MTDRKVTSTEFQNSVGRYQDAAQAAPVTITKNGRPHTVMISADEYARLKARDRRVVRIEHLGNAEIEALAQAEVPEEYAHLDDLVKPKP